MYVTGIYTISPKASTWLESIWLFIVYELFAIFQVIYFQNHTSLFSILYFFLQRLYFFLMSSISYNLSDPVIYPLNNNVQYSPFTCWLFAALSSFHIVPIFRIFVLSYSPLAPYFETHQRVLLFLPRRCSRHSIWASTTSFLGGKVRFFENIVFAFGILAHIILVQYWSLAMMLPNYLKYSN